MKQSYSLDDISLASQVASSLESSKEASLRQEFSINGRTYAFGLPFIPAPMDTVCGTTLMKTLREYDSPGILHRRNSHEEFQSSISELLELPEAKGTADFYRQVPIGFAVGLKNYAKRLEVIEAHYDRKFLVCIDTANGFSTHVKAAVDWIKREFPRVAIMAGNVNSAAGYEYLSDIGVDFVRIGIGNGSMCKTGEVTGIGAGSATLLLEVKRGALIVADGGLRTTGQIAKALALGADLVMMGNMFAGYDESCGELRDGKKYFRGMASLGASRDLGSMHEAPEGEETWIEARGPIRPKLTEWKAALQRSMSYFNARTLEEFRHNVRHYGEINVLTSSAVRERSPFGA